MTDEQFELARELRGKIAVLEKSLSAVKHFCWPDCIYDAVATPTELVKEEIRDLFARDYERQIADLRAEYAAL